MFVLMPQEGHVMVKVEIELSERERKIAEAAWAAGAMWAAVECGVVRDEHEHWLVPADNPYRKEQNV